jgi:alpha-beta hydrolase superfamily lysophospholipase
MIDNKPIYFGERHEVFGWFHPAKFKERSTRGVVIVSPNGIDMLNMHWGLRKCAETFAAAGIPVIRFDLAGTGDSLGDDEQADRVATWIQSTHSAIDQLKSICGVDYVTLLGVRLGATIAATVGTTRADVSSIILYVPCVTGKQYTREMRALAATAIHIDNSSAHAKNPNDISMAGWLLSEQTINDLSKLDISKLSYLNKRVLYIHRDDLNPDQKLVTSIQSSAEESQIKSSTEFSAFSQDPLFGILPARDFEVMRDWACADSNNYNPEGSFQPVSRSNYRTELLSDGFSEEPLFFGKNISMFGIICKPKSIRHHLCVVIVNTGANHHIGNHRTTVVLARGLAGAGIPSLRIDITGVGDSELRRGRRLNDVYYLPATEDIVQAIEFAEDLGFKDIMLFGVCSGGYLSYNTAAIDPRVKILTIVNLLRFVWRDTDTLTGGDNISAASLESYSQKMFKRDTWRRLVKGEINLAFLRRAIATRLTQKLKHKIPEILHRIFMPNKGANPVEKNCIAMLERGTQINMIYSAGDGGMDEVALYLGHRGSRLRKYLGYRFIEVKNADHTFTSKASCRTLLDLCIDSVNRFINP